jgi:hypothetical protein
MVTVERIPLDFVVRQDKLMKPLWMALTPMQKVTVKAFYGLPLAGAEEHRMWAILNQAATFDALGYPIEVFEFPYEPREFDTLIVLAGRRSGKSYVSGFVALYEILFGGHTSPTYIEPGQDVIVPYIAQDLPTARANMKYIAIFAQKVDALRKRLKDVKADYIKFDNGITVQIEPPTIKTGRGWAIPMVIMDEVGYWYKLVESANPDFEVQRAVSAAQSQFPHKKQLLISSPYIEVGILWDADRAGTNGYKLAEGDEEKGAYQGTLVLKASTAAVQNPRGPSKARLLIEQIRDPDGFKREYLAQFTSAVNGFLSADVVKEAVVKGLKEASRKEIEKSGMRPYYVAVMDPAFRHDTFAFGIFHRTAKGEIHMDLLRTWEPSPKLGLRLDPRQILEEIATLLKAWQVKLVYSDQYQLEALQQLALQLGFSIIGHDFTGKSKAKLYGSLSKALQLKQLKLLDIPVIYQQLVLLQKKLNPMGGVMISAPSGKRDDVATVVALGAGMSLQMLPQFEPKVRREPTLVAMGLAQIKRQQIEARNEGVWV